MKRFLTILTFCLLTVLPGCALFTPQVVKTALDATQYACILAKMDLPDSKAIATACNIDQSLAPLIEMLVAETKMRVQMEAQKPGMCRDNSSAPKK